ncbi:thioredoxin domain-containing protein 11 isoform X2 [Rhizophagus irregularis DAOM 181602=DAOM 197198]|nr:thioredoxin domain-containing protein 11 isoform X2 [Rhizophagus irregularis DAOM 181602=DAOM 197198]
MQKILPILSNITLDYIWLPVSSCSVEQESTSTLSNEIILVQAHRVKATDKYRSTLNLALNTTDNQELRNKLKTMKETVDDARILRDWETWMQEKTAILVRRGVRNTNLNLHEEINTLSLSKDEPSVKNTKDQEEEDQEEEDQEEEDQEEEDQDEEDQDEEDQDEVDQDEEDQDEEDQEEEDREEEDRKEEGRIQANTIPEAQKCLNLAYWNILDLTEDTQIKSLFSTNDWEEMVESFNNEVKLVESDFLDVVEYFFDEVGQITKKDDKDIINAIDRLTPEIIETNRKIKLSDEEKNVISILRRAVVTYAENLERVDLPISEADFDNAFPNMLAKRFLNREELKMDVGEIACWASACRRNEGRSVVLRARIGQKCDFRGTLKKSINRLEALIGLRSGGLPEPHRKKIYEDKVDLSVAMRDVLYTFFRENSNAPSSEIHSTFVFGIHSWGWVHNIYGMDCKATNILRLGSISHSKMPNTLKMLPVLESFYVLFTDLQDTLSTICEHTNSVSLAHSLIHRNRKRKNPEKAENISPYITASIGNIKLFACQKCSRITTYGSSILYTFHAVLLVLQLQIHIHNRWWTKILCYNFLT